MIASDYIVCSRSADFYNDRFAWPDGADCRRLFLTVGRGRCPFACAYCFASFSNYERVPTLDEVEGQGLDIRKFDVVYPACDVDLIATPDPVDHLWRIARHGRSISVSTKARVSHTLAEQMRSIDLYLHTRGHRLKVGISIATKRSCRTLETGAASYRERLASLARLHDTGTGVALVLRPLLPDVPDAEYREILDEARVSAPRVLFGEEYIDETRPRLSLNQRQFPICDKSVGWLPQHPQWKYVNSEQRIRELSEYARRLGYRPFTSDADLMTDLVQSKSE